MGRVKDSRVGEGTHPLSILLGPRICCFSWSGSTGRKQDSLKLQEVIFIYGGHLSMCEQVSRSFALGL